MQQLHLILGDLRQKQQESGGYQISYAIQKHEHELQELKHKYFKVIKWKSTIQVILLLIF